MNETEHLLTCLSEEGTEVAEVFAELLAAVSRTGKRASKALRFGLDEIQPGQDASNGERIVAELNDLLGVAELLQDAGVIKDFGNRAAVEAKKAKVRAFLEYSAECGTLTTPTE